MIFAGAALINHHLLYNPKAAHTHRQDKLLPRLRTGQISKENPFFLSNQQAEVAVPELSLKEPTGREEMTFITRLSVTAANWIENSENPTLAYFSLFYRLFLKSVWTD